MQPLHVLVRVHHVAQVQVLLGAEHRVIDEDAVHLRVEVGGFDRRLYSEPLHRPELELHPDVFAALLRVFGVGARRPVVGHQKADQAQGLRELSDLRPELVPETSSHLARIDDNGRHPPMLLTSCARNKRGGGTSR